MSTLASPSLVPLCSSPTRVCCVGPCRHQKTQLSLEPTHWGSPWRFMGSKLAMAFVLCPLLELVGGVLPV